MALSRKSIRRAIPSSRETESLKSVLTRCLSAASVYQALLELSCTQKRSWVFTSRASIRELTGLSKNTISKALTALHEAGWIERGLHYLKDNGALKSLLRVQILRDPMDPTMATKFRRTQRRPKSGSHKADQKPLRNSSKEEGTSPPACRRRSVPVPTQANRDQHAGPDGVSVAGVSATGDDASGAQSSVLVSAPATIDPVSGVPIVLALHTARLRQDDAEIGRLMALQEGRDHAS